MDFKFEPIPLVQRKKKYATFTVREIGGSAEVIKWRQEQDAKAALYNLRIKARDDRMSDFAESLGGNVATPTVGKTESWQDKVAFAESERARLAKAEAIASEAWIPAPSPKLTIFQRIKGFFRKLWNTANF